MPSIYAECSEAARKLLDGVEQPSEYEIPGIFTELDVIAVAARRANGWTKDQRKLAQHEASQAMGALFRTGRATRYGPVYLPGITEPDYMRVASKIVYASAETGPTSIETPNGTFPQMSIADDGIGRKGRRLGGNRNDFEPWINQDILGDEDDPESTEQREIRRLHRELQSAHRRIYELEEERVTRSEVEELRNRLASLEGAINSQA